MLLRPYLHASNTRSMFSAGDTKTHDIALEPANQILQMMKVEPLDLKRVEFSQSMMYFTIKWDELGIG